jgi:hypothetical protein
VKLDPEYLRQHYASLSDQGLMEIHRADLVETARAIFDQEVRRRNLARTAVPSSPDPLDEHAAAEPYAGEEDPGWLEDAAEVYGYTVQSEAVPAPDPALDALDALKAAGIPGSLDLYEIPPEERHSDGGTHRWRLMVPGNLVRRATGILQRDIFNVEFEEVWKAQLEALSDEELRFTNPQVEFCGLYDQIARVNRVYAEEFARRGLKQK